MSLVVTSDYVRDDESSTFTVIGLVTDGVTDNRTKIQAVIDACNTAGGGTILLPGGDIYCSHGSAYSSGWGHTVMNSLIASLDIKSNIHICGTGTTKIITPSTTPGGSSARMSVLTRSGASNITISGIKFNGSATSSDSESDSYGITLVGDNSAGDIRISDCEWSNYRGRIMLARGRDTTSADAGGSLTPSATKWVSRVSCRGNRIKDSLGNGFGFFSCIDSENDITFQNDNLKVPTGGGAEPNIIRGHENIRLSRQIIRNWGGGITAGANATSTAKNRNILVSDLNWKTCSAENNPPPYTGLNATIRDADLASFGGSTGLLIERMLFTGSVLDESGRYSGNAKFIIKFDLSTLVGLHGNAVRETTTDYTSYSGGDLVVDGVDNTKVTSATFTFNSDHIGCPFEITGGVGWTQAVYRIVAVSGGAATLDSSPAATGTTGGAYLFNNGGGLMAGGGDGLLITGVVHSRSTFTTDSATFTAGRSGCTVGTLGTYDSTPSQGSMAFCSVDSGISKRGGANVIFGNYAQNAGSSFPLSGSVNPGVTCGNCYVLETGTDADGLRADNTHDNTRMSFFMNTQVINQSSASTRMTNFTHPTTTFAGIACNLARNRNTGTNGYYIAGGGDIYVLNNLYSRSGGTLNVTVGGSGVNSNNASFSG